MSEATVDNGRRVWLISTCAMGGVGAAAVAVPFVSTLQPSARARAAGASVEADISRLQPGQKMVVEWRGRPVWILYRTPEMIASLEAVEPRLADPNSERRMFPIPEYARNRYRSIKPELLVAVGICTHFGCSPTARFATGDQPGLPNDWPGGFFCPCHGSAFDLSGRVFANMPAPDNLEIPPHQYLSDTLLLVGEDQQA